MKKLTKKIIAEQPKFIAIIDYKVGVEKAFDYIDLEASDVFHAMSEAAELYNDNVWCIDIAQLNMDVADEVVSKGCHCDYMRELYYEDCLKSFGDGWHPVVNHKSVYNRIVLDVIGPVTGLCVGGWSRVN